MYAINCTENRQHNKHGGQLVTNHCMKHLKSIIISEKLRENQTLNPQYFLDKYCNISVPIHG